MPIRAEAPCRIDLAGGTLDIHPLYLFLPEACTVNLAIDVTATAVVSDLAGGRTELESQDRGLKAKLSPGGSDQLPKGLELAATIVQRLVPEGGVAVRTRSGSPVGAGLAASSALCVALTSALLLRRGETLVAADLVRLCLDLEAEVLGTPAGCQDHYAALNGGLQEIRFAPGAVEARQLAADLGELRRRMTLVYTGRPRHSGLNNWEVYKAFIDGDENVRSALAEIGYAAVQMAGALCSGDWAAVGSLLAREWRQRKRLSPMIATPAVDALVEEAEKLGGAGKVCGAGGGGCVVLWHDGGGEARQRIGETARRLGATEIEWSPAAQGCRVGRLTKQ